MKNFLININMKKNFLLKKILIVYLIMSFSALAKQNNYLEQGIKLFNKSEFEKSRIFFEKDIVFNPRSENSYLYLAKIFNEEEKDEETENNLNNVLLLNPSNEEALYLLTLLKIKQSDYKEAKELITKFEIVCSTFCSKKKEIEKKMEGLTPENAKNND